MWQGRSRKMPMWRGWKRLIEDKRFDDIARIKADNGYRQKLYLEYHII